MGIYSLQEFKKAVLFCSRSKDFKEAKQEFVLYNIYLSPRTKACVCGHRPIRKIYQLDNVFTGKRLEVGAECIAHFLNLPSAKLLKNLMFVLRDNRQYGGQEFIDHFRDIGWVDNKTWSAYVGTGALSSPEAAIDVRMEINREILARSRRARARLVARGGGIVEESRVLVGLRSM